MPPDPREGDLANAASALLGQEHVLARAIDDSVSKEAFHRLIEELDVGKVFLLEGDVQKLARFETDMDDELLTGDLVLGRKAAALLASRRRLVADVIARTLAAPLEFTANESIETDPKKRAFCKTEEELATRWRSVLKLQVLERTQELEDILEKRAHPKPDAPSSKAPADPDDAKREAAAEKALGEIPATFEGRRDKVQKELATRLSTQFTRLASVDKLAPAQRFINAVNGAFDPHTTYLPPAEEAELGIQLTGRLEGIGATLREQEHYILVNDLVPGGAAWQQGKLEAGDLILSVAQDGKEPVDVMDMPIGKVVSMIRGPKGTVVLLTVKKPDGTVKTISITRVRGLDADHVARDRDRLEGSTRLLHLEEDDRALRPADHAHHLPDGHVHHVDGLFALLCDGQDEVAGLELSLLPGGAAGHEIVHEDVVFLLAQRGADALEAAGDRDAEVRLFRGWQRGRVRIEGAVHCVDERLRRRELVDGGKPCELRGVARGELLLHLVAPRLERRGDLSERLLRSRLTLGIVGVGGLG